MNKTRPASARRPHPGNQNARPGPRVPDEGDAGLLDLAHHRLQV